MKGIKGVLLSLTLCVAGIFIGVFVSGMLSSKKEDIIRASVENYMSNRYESEIKEIQESYLAMEESIYEEYSSMVDELEQETEQIEVEQTEETTEEMYNPYEDPDFVEPSSLSREALDNTTVEYNIDMHEPGAAFVPNLLLQWRIQNNIQSGTINVFDFEMKESEIIITFELDGYPYTIECDIPSAYGPD